MKNVNRHAYVSVFAFRSYMFNDRCHESLSLEELIYTCR